MGLGNIMPLVYNMRIICWSFFLSVSHVDVQWMNPLQKENMSHMLASMHLVIRLADGKEETAGTYNHLTNTTYEKFIER